MAFDGVFVVISSVQLQPTVIQTLHILQHRKTSFKVGVIYETT
jgi:hypothetical protein